MVRQAPKENSVGRNLRRTLAGSPTGWPRNLRQRRGTRPELPLARWPPRTPDPRCLRRRLAPAARRQNHWPRRVPAAAPPWQTPRQPIPAAAPPGTAASKRNLLSPSAIGVVFALPLAALGIAIGLLTSSGAHQRDGAAALSADGPASPSTSAEPFEPPPPLVLGPDNSAAQARSDQGFTLPTATGWGSLGPRTATLAATSAGGRRVGRWTAIPRLRSARQGSEAWINCNGGTYARVYLY